jgi:hypothetical protein
MWANIRTRAHSTPDPGGWKSFFSYSIENNFHMPLMTTKELVIDCLVTQRNPQSPESENAESDIARSRTSLARPDPGLV